MKINVVGLVVVALVICGAVYYFNHNRIEGKLNIKGSEGNKSQVSVKVGGSKVND